MNRLKIQSTVYPETKEKNERMICKNIPFGIMKEFWNKDGSFNVDLYQSIAAYKSNSQPDLI